MSKGMLRGLATLFFVFTITSTIAGFRTMYTYGDTQADPKDYTGHIVGADAYNYIIIGVRGLGYMMGALCFAVIGTGLLIRAGQVEMIENLGGPKSWPETEAQRRQNETVRRLEAESETAD